METKGYILLVDDEPAARSALAELLRYEGYRVETAGSAEEALTHTSRDRPDIVLTDLRMPGIGGLELLQRMREADPRASIVVMTAYAAFDSIVAAMKAGAVDYLLKPVDIAELVPLLEREILKRRVTVPPSAGGG